MHFDLIVIGGGSGANVMSWAADAGHRVAIIEEGPLGGTCLNRGCIPSKIVLHSADVAETIDNAHLFGIKPSGYKVDFAAVTRRAFYHVDKEAVEIEEAIKGSENIELFKARGKFVAERAVAVGSKKITGDKVVIAAGTRPTVPPLDGIEGIKYLTSDNCMRLTKQPKSMIVMGGGFIAAEMAHFFGALGTKVTIVQRSVMLREEDREIADAFTHIFGQKHKIVLGYSPTKVRQLNEKIVLTTQKDKETKTFAADTLLIATGRVPNTDILEVTKGGVAVDERGYVKVNEYLETTAQDTWALGDIVGKYLLKHSANLEAEYVWNNAFGSRKKPVDYWPMPHAIFTSPQIAAVGYTEEELREKKIDYTIGKYNYRDTGMGLALEADGFVKILADKKTHKILGCHIIGPDASTLIHEVILAIKLGATVEQVYDTTHVHPALPEVVQRAAGNVEW